MITVSNRHSGCLNSSSDIYKRIKLPVLFSSLSCHCAKCCYEFVFPSDEAKTPSETQFTESKVSISWLFLCNLFLPPLLSFFRTAAKTVLKRS